MRCKERINVNGCSIAMGRPLSTTGAARVGALVDECERRKQRRGLVTLCAARGVGIAALIERA